MRCLRDVTVLYRVVLALYILTEVHLVDSVFVFILVLYGCWMNLCLGYPFF